VAGLSGRPANGWSRSIAQAGDGPVTATGGWRRLTLLVVALGCTRTTELASVGATTASCSPPGPAIHLGGTGTASCAGVLAAQAARYALCSCKDVAVPGDLIVNSLGAPGRPTRPGGGTGAGGSRGQGPWPAGIPMDGLLPPAFFAAVGTDGNFQTTGHGDVPGSLVVAGTGDVTIGTQGHVLGNARIAGNLRPKSSYWITGDGYVAGDVAGAVTVGGTMHTSAGSTIDSTVQARAAVREPVAVPPPCNCEAGPVFDVGDAVEARRNKNSNAQLTFSPGTLTDVPSPTTLDWPCGEYYLDTLRSSDAGALELRIHGHVGIFVGGDVRLANTFTVTLDDGASLDLVVAGSVYTTGRVFGSPSAPAEMRLWVGSSTVSLPDQIQFGAFVYAPDAVFSAGSGLTFTGSLFVDTLSVGGNLLLGFDPDLNGAGAECGFDPPDPVK